MNRLTSNFVTQPSADNRFAKPFGRVIRDDLARYAEELNAGPLKGWFVNRDKAGRWFLDRQNALPETTWKPTAEEFAALKRNIARLGAPE